MERKNNLASRSWRKYYRQFLIEKSEIRNPILSTSNKIMAEIKKKVALPVIVDKPTPYEFDLGLLLAKDPNPLELSGDLEADLAATARDGAQALLNQLLSTCPIASTPAGVLLSLPAPTTPLPREKVRSNWETGILDI